MHGNGPIRCYIASGARIPWNKRFQADFFHAVVAYLEVPKIENIEKGKEGVCKKMQEMGNEVSKQMDEELLEMMKSIQERCKGDHKLTHQEMNIAYIGYLSENPCLMDPAFWKNMGEEPSAISKWESYQIMMEEFLAYCKEHNISKKLCETYYFHFQSLAFGAAFVIAANLRRREGTPILDLLDIQRSIYAGLDEKAGIAKE